MVIEKMNVYMYIIFPMISHLHQKNEAMIIEKMTVYSLLNRNTHDQG